MDDFLELIEYNNLQILKIYCEINKQHIDTKKRNNVGKTALILAVETGNIEIINFIGSLGNVNETDWYGMNALHHLFKMQNPSIENAYHLIALGVPLFEVDANNKKPLDYVTDQDFVEMFVPQKRRKLI